MIDVTDRHCRYFHRLLAPKARLYTEMIATGAIEHGDRARHLDFSDEEHPVALQLGGCEPAALARAARLAEQWRYDEINLNCGCPSERVQRGAFGACLMAEPMLVADCIKAMLDVVNVPVTVKHRLGLDYDESYAFVRDFVGALHDAGCRVFIVHARNAVLKGLSPKENRQVPPLRYAIAQQLKADFPDSRFVLNGGISDVGSAHEWMQKLDGAMLGRLAWHQPHLLSDIHRLYWPDEPLQNPDEVVSTMLDYASKQIGQGTPLRFVLRPMLGWLSGQPGARVWRQTLSDSRLLNENRPSLLEAAWRLRRKQLAAEQY